MSYVPFNNIQITTSTILFIFYFLQYAELDQ